MEIAKRVYPILRHLPDFEKFGLQSQLARSAISIPSNIAEGCAKSSTKDFKRYLEFSLGSAYELETQLILTSDIHGLETEELIEKLNHEQMMITSLIKKLK